MQTSGPPALNYAAIGVNALGITVAVSWYEAVRRVLASAFPADDTQSSARVAVITALCMTICVIAIAAAVNLATRRLSPDQSRAAPCLREPAGQAPGRS